MEGCANVGGCVNVGIGCVVAAVGGRWVVDNSDAVGACRG